MDKALTIKDDVKETAKKMDLIIRDCLPITQAKTQGITEALVLAKGISQLREIFLKDQNIQVTIKAMQDTKLGFLTDRSPDAIKKSKGYGKALTAYTYNEIAECCIEALLKGYRLTDNEFNIIAGNFYAAKNGKYRLIIETEGLTDLSFANSMPVFKTETRMVKKIPTQVAYAEVQCYASWKMDGKNVYLGHHPENKENKDVLVFKIKTNEYMGDDGVVGKSLSKLFTRILIRLSGKLIEESSDIEPQGIKIINETSDVKDLTEKIKAAPKSESIDVNKPEAKIKTSDKIKDVKKDPQSDMGKAPMNEAAAAAMLMQIIKSFEFQKISETEICAYFGIDDLMEMNTPDGLIDLQKIASDIEGSKMSPDEFKQKAADRFEMRLKEK